MCPSPGMVSTAQIFRNAHRISLSDLGSNMRQEPNRERSSSPFSSLAAIEHGSLSWYPRPRTVRFEVVVGEVAPGFLQISLELFPLAFELILVHHQDDRGVLALGPGGRPLIPGFRHPEGRGRHEPKEDGGG